MSTRLTEDECRAIIKLKEDGMSLKDIVKESGRSREGVVNCLGRYGLHEPIVNREGCYRGQRIFEKWYKKHTGNSKPVYNAWESLDSYNRSKFIEAGKSEYLKICKERYDELFSYPVTHSKIFENDKNVVQDSNFVKVSDIREYLKDYRNSVISEKDTTIQIDFNNMIFDTIEKFIERMISDLNSKN